MNFKDELEMLVRTGYPVLTIISNKQTCDPGFAVKVANKRRNYCLPGATGTPGSTYSQYQSSDAVEGAARQRNCAT